MKKHLLLICGMAVLASLAACSSSSGEGGAISTSTAPGTLIYSPPLRLASLSKDDFTARLAASPSGAALMQLAGPPSCGVDFYYIEYQTRGATAENATASGALMVPNGSDAICSGSRPLVLYAHGTTVEKNFNIADIVNTLNPANAQSALVAAVFAAQGFVLVAPNFAGYDISSLAYHPYLNAAQQSADMIDSLTAARSALPTLIGAPVSDSGQLLVTGYSQGGYVAMATARALEAAGQVPTASAPMSGPYALEAFGDAIFYGQVNIGSTIFSPLMVSSYQHAYHDLYTSTTDIFSANYATGIDTLLPTTSSLTGLFTSGKLPQLTLFDINTPTGYGGLDAVFAVPANPLFASGFGASPLVANSYRVSYVLEAYGNPDHALPFPMPSPGAPLADAPPAQPLRHALWQNDMRNSAGPGPWFPHSPMLMCGGGQDPTVFYSVNTGTMQAFWGALPLPPGLVNTLDLSAAPGGQFALLQGAFQQTQAQELAFLQTPAGGGLTLAQAQAQLVGEYHGAVAPFCTLGAREFYKFVMSL